VNEKAVIEEARVGQDTIVGMESNGAGETIYVSYVEQVFVLR